MTFHPHKALTPNFRHPVGVETMEKQQKYARLAVKDMPLPLATVARENDHPEDHEMTCEEALRLWSTWELGDPQWATDILRLADDFRTDLREREGQ